MPLSSSPALLISIHAPPRGATKGIYGGEVSLLFQFTPLREGRLVRSPYDGSEEQFQFTPLREGRRSAGLGRSRSNISIHAPPRGATDEDKAKLWDNKFQFTPLREGRRFSAAYVEAHDDFNSRPSARGDTYSPKQPHLPTHFNSRPSARGDIKLQVRLYSSPFQFTPLREGRLAERETSIDAPSGFQFTPLREGRLLLLLHWKKSARISIHAPPRGATAPPRKRVATQRISIHAPPRGATLIISRQDLPKFHFNSRPSARGDAETADNNADIAKFQFTPLREGRRILFVYIFFAYIFQFTPLREGRLLLVEFWNEFFYYFNSRPSARGDSKRYAISANLLFNPYKSAWLNNNATQFVEIILVIFHRIIV